MIVHATRVFCTQQLLALKAHTKHAIPHHDGRPRSFVNLLQRCGMLPLFVGVFPLKTEVISAGQWLVTTAAGVIFLIPRACFGDPHIGQRQRMVCAQILLPSVNISDN